MKRAIRDPILLMSDSSRGSNGGFLFQLPNCCCTAMAHESPLSWPVILTTLLLFIAVSSACPVLLCRPSRPPRIHPPSHFDTCGCSWSRARSIILSSFYCPTLNPTLTLPCSISLSQIYHTDMSYLCLGQHQLEQPESLNTCPIRMLCHPSQILEEP
jgi:hypothetical protein